MNESFESYQGVSMPEGIESTGTNESAESSPEAIARIEKNQKKAKAIAQQIRKSKQENKHIAAFLVMIFQVVDSDKLIAALHHVFFQEDTGGAQHNINNKLIAGLFAPFFSSVLADYYVNGYYSSLITPQSTRSIDGYINYLKHLSAAYHNNVALNQQKLTQLIIYILKYFDIITDAPEPEYKQQILTKLLHELFGIQNHVNTKVLDF